MPSGYPCLGGLRAIPSVRPGGFRAIPSGRLEPEGFRAIPSVLWRPELPRRLIPVRGALELGGFRAIPSARPSWAAYLEGRAIPLPPGRLGGLPNRAILSSGAPG